MLLVFLSLTLVRICHSEELISVLVPNRKTMPVVSVQRNTDIIF